jgi:hypothetical protein
MAPIIEETDQLQMLPGLTSRLLTLALRALSGYLLVWVAAVGGGALWAYTVMQPSPLRIIATVGYAVTILLPILIRDMRSA